MGVHGISGGRLQHRGGGDASTFFPPSSYLISDRRLPVPAPAADPHNSSTTGLLSFAAVRYSTACRNLS